MTNNFQAKAKSFACSSEESNSDKLAAVMVKILETASKNAKCSEIVSKSETDEAIVVKTQTDDEEISGQDVTISK
jgi:hypothetical protein